MTTHATLLHARTAVAQGTAAFHFDTMTAMSQSSLAWDGSTGPIDEALLARAAEELAQPVYVIAGPPAMAEAMHMTLSEAGVSDPDIRSESFYGY